MPPCLGFAEERSDHDGHGHGRNAVEDEEEKHNANAIVFENINEEQNNGADHCQCHHIHTIYGHPSKPDETQKDL